MFWIGWLLLLNLNSPRTDLKSAALSAARKASLSFDARLGKRRKDQVGRIPALRRIDRGQAVVFGLEGFDELLVGLVVEILRPGGGVPDAESGLADRRQDVLAEGEARAHDRNSHARLGVLLHEGKSGMDFRSCFCPRQSTAIPSVPAPNNNSIHACPCASTNIYWDHIGTGRRDGCHEHGRKRRSLLATRGGS